jgi:hypothetical protein
VTGDVVDVVDVAGVDDTVLAAVGPGVVSLEQAPSRPAITTITIERRIARSVRRVREGGVRRT